MPTRSARLPAWSRWKEGVLGVCATVSPVIMLNTLWKKVVKWGERDKVPCTMKLLTNPKKTMGLGKN